MTAMAKIAAAGYCVLGLLLLPQLVFGECAPRLNGVTGGAGVSVIRLTGAEGNGGTIDNSAMNTASSNWNGQCDEGSPEITTQSGTTGMQVQVNFWSGPPSSYPTLAQGSCSTCACTRTQINSTGRIADATVHMFSEQNNGVSCTSSNSQILTHELGHAQGLGHQNCSQPGGCGGIMNGSTGLSGSVGTMECSVVDNNFTTGAEVGGPGGGSHGPCGT